MLESIGVRYALGGSLASSIVGEPRSTIDIDMAVEMTLSQLDQLIEHCVPDARKDERERSNKMIETELRQVDERH